MQTLPTITFRNMATSPAIERLIHKKLAAVEKHYPRLEGAEVTIDRPQGRRVSGSGFEVRVRLVVPGSDQFAGKLIQHGETAENVELALNAAFEAALRSLEAHAERMEPSHEGHHARIEHGRIDRMFEGEGYGFIRAEEDRREYYFSREALTSDVWTRLKVDSRVRFHAEDGENGPYAANVTLLEA